MDVAAVGAQTRRPRFRRATEPPPFRLTDDDVEIVRVVARHRLIRSTHIAALVGRVGDRIGAVAGMSGRGYEKAEAVVAAAEAEVRREKAHSSRRFSDLSRDRFSR